MVIWKFAEIVVDFSIPTASTHFQGFSKKHRALMPARGQALSMPLRQAFVPKGKTAGIHSAGNSRMLNISMRYEQMEGPMNIEQGNADDVSFLARWLKEEWDRDGMGLWNNWEGIYKRTTEGKFLVYRVAGEAIGFYAYCGKGLGYLSIREDYRRQGIGRALVNKAKDIVFASGAEAYVVETAVGGSDRPFWFALGFTVPDGFERTLVMAIDAPS